VLGRSGELTGIMRGLRDVPAEERPAIANCQRNQSELEARIEELLQSQERESLDKSLARSVSTSRARTEVLEPVASSDAGHRRMLQIFNALGFESSIPRTSRMISTILRR